MILDFPFLGTERKKNVSVDLDLNPTQVEGTLIRQLVVNILCLKYSILFQFFRGGRLLLLLFNASQI